ncbi:RadC family protein [Rickettsia endosymbiont of Polydrusus tereticollis]|uniref:RadC family protein n=1 Tax=Rickettsia endosymbiont of Polydrusus tereticollis TaxID=3066251 RepID=UPI003132AFED
MKSNLYLNNFNVWDLTYENDIEKVESLNEAAEDDPNHIRPHYIGHRKRVKQRLINAGGASGFSDYELLELILFSAIPRKDVKPLAKKLLEKFKNLTNLISLDKDKLLTISGTNENLYVNFAVMRELINRVLKQRITNKNIIGSWGALVDYLKVTMSSMPLEQFRILFLNKKNILIADEVLSQGTIDQAAIYPREIIKRALFNEASAIILVHNHPSGSSQPSKADIDTTRKIVETCHTVNISVHDHVIIANNDYFSFKSNMLL